MLKIPPDEYAEILVELFTKKPLQMVMVTIFWIVIIITLIIINYIN